MSGTDIAHAATRNGRGQTCKPPFLLNVVAFIEAELKIGEEAASRAEIFGGFAAILGGIVLRIAMPCA
eukprot:524690-Rhodomonas_salina.2